MLACAHQQELTDPEPERSEMAQQMHKAILQHAGELRNSIATAMAGDVFLRGFLDDGNRGASKRPSHCL